MMLREAQRVGLTEAQRHLFERDGYVVVETRSTRTWSPGSPKAVDRVWRRTGSAPVAGADPLHLLAFVGRDPLFLKLMDHEPSCDWWSTCSDGTLHQPLSLTCTRVRGPVAARVVWHQDGGIQNTHLETTRVRACR